MHLTGTIANIFYLKKMLHFVENLKGDVRVYNIGRIKHECLQLYTQLTWYAFAFLCL